MKRIAFGTYTLLLLMLTLAACGGGGGDPAPSDIGTLAYVETECRDTKAGFIERQALRIRQGEREPVTVFETPGVGPVTGVGGLCGAVTRIRDETAVSRDAIQSVAVSPDGDSVAFEVTDEFSSFPPLPLSLRPEQKGIFWVRADGTGLRRLGPPPRARFFQGIAAIWIQLSFSPNGRTILLVDKGPDADGHEAEQVVTTDVATGAPTQLTQLPPAVPPAGFPTDNPTIGVPVFFDEQTIGFVSTANPNGLNPGGAYVLMTVKTDSSHRLDVPLPIPIALPGGQIELRIAITGNRPQVFNASPPGKPDDSSLGSVIREIFVVDERKDILQLTNFHRSDTIPATMEADREHVYFYASADPLGTNPSHNCQIFSIERTGGDLRQLTNFRETERSRHGCASGPLGTGCLVFFNYAQRAGLLDPRRPALVFGSSCDPLGQNPNGYQLFAMQPDGTGLRQLTTSRGLVKEADGTYSSEMPGPWAYGPYKP